MTDHDLKAQLEELFSDAEAEPGVGPEPSESQWEGAIVGLLGDDTKAEAATVEPPSPVLAELELVREDQKTPGEDTGAPESTQGEGRTRILGVLAHGITILGAVLLIVLLIGLIRQEPMSWPEFRVLYVAALAIVLIITVAQWMLSSSLSRRLQETEESQSQAIRSQADMQKRADELAAANAMLQRRTLQLQTAVQIARTTAEAPDLDALGERAITLIREGLDLYYVGLFLLDETGQWAVLRSGTGEVGRRLAAQGDRVKVGDISAVGLCTASGQVRIAPDLSSASAGGPIPVDSLLPETRSEMALPLRSRDRVIGALEVHSTQHEAFSQEDSAALQTVADQLAVAIDHARDLDEARAGLAEMNARQARRGPRQWTDPRRVEAISYYERTRPGTTAPVTEGDDTSGQAKPDGNAVGPVEALKRAVEQAMAQQAVVVRTEAGDEAARSAVVAPLSLRGEVIGALGLCDPEGKQHWTDDEIALVEAIADQMALALENVRLLDETQQRAERDRLMASITARIRSSMDTQTILQTAVRELGTALGTDRTFIRLSSSTSPSEESEE